MKAYVITIMNNEKSVQSAERCIKSAAKFGVEVEKFKAITPADDPKTMMMQRQINPENFDEIYSRTPNCMAAFLSHFTLWEKCALDNETYLIFEHDAIMTGFLPPNPQFMYCMTIGKPSYGNYNTPMGFGVNPLTQKDYFGGAHSYMLKPNGAWSLIEGAQRNPGPTDVFLNKENFPWLQELYPWVAEAKDNFSTIQVTRGCLAKHQYNEETYRIENV